MSPRQCSPPPNRSLERCYPGHPAEYGHTAVSAVMRDEACALLEPLLALKKCQSGNAAFLQAAFCGTHTGAIQHST